MTQHYPVQLYDVDKLVPYANNAKIHTEEQVSKIANLIEGVGWTSPIIVWKDGEIIAGHGRRLAALKLGLKKVPVIDRSDLTAAEARAMRLADNKVASNDYDQQLVAIELRDLFEAGDLDIPFEDMGYSERDLDFVTADLGEINEDFFTDDLNEAVEEQKRENEKTVAATDDIAAPIGDALGFKRVTIAQSRTLRDLMTGIETRTGKKGVEALIDVLSDAQ